MAKFNKCLDATTPLKIWFPIKVKSRAIDLKASLTVKEKSIKNRKYLNGIATDQK